MFKSIIIPFFDSAKFLATLLNSLNHQTTGDFEILLIDNGSTDKGRDLIKNFAEESNLKIKILTFNKFPSSYAARNIGVKQAKGEILAFTDSDCMPEPDWLEQIQKAFEQSEELNLVVSGHVELMIEDETNPWELFDHHFHMDNTQAEKNARIATANMAVRKSFFEKAGDFEEVSSGGDHHWSEKAVAAGAKIKYIPEVRVKHPTRKTRQEILKKVKRTSRGLGEMSSSGWMPFVKGAGKTLLRPFLIHRHLNFAVSETFKASLFFRIRLFSLSFWVRCCQVPSFFSGILNSTSNSKKSE